jgi:hypothetical protein
MTTPNAQLPAPAELHRVVTLLRVNLALSALLAVLVAVFHTALLNFQMQRLALPTSADTTGAREGLSIGLWSRVITVVVIAAVYVVLIRRLRAGRRRAYLRVLILSVVSLLGIGYLVFSAQYPAWVLVEQAVQALVLLALLWAVTRPAVRRYFARPA